MKLNHVVVTGYGLTSPIGNTPEEFWNSLKEGKDWDWYDYKI